MPGFNGTGPEGAGAMTGGGRGNCSGNTAGAGRGAGRGAGCGRGMGRGAGGGGVHRLEDAEAVSGAPAGNADAVKMLSAVVQRLDTMQADLDSVKEQLHAGTGDTQDGTENDGA